MDERERISAALGAERHLQLRYLAYAVALARIVVAAAKAVMRRPRDTGSGGQLFTSLAEMPCNDVVLEHLVGPVDQVAAIRQNAFVSVDYVRDCGVVDLSRGFYGIDDLLQPFRGTHTECSYLAHHLAGGTVGPSALASRQCRRPPIR